MNNWIWIAENTQAFNVPNGVVFKTNEGICFIPGTYASIVEGERFGTISYLFTGSVLTSGYLQTVDVPNTTSYNSGDTVTIS